jgi:hypothetical protein
VESLDLTLETKLADKIVNDFAKRHHRAAPSRLIRRVHASHLVTHRGRWPKWSGETNMWVRLELTQMKV